MFLGGNLGVFWGNGCKIDICEMEKTIFLREALLEMKKLDEKKNPIPFSIKVRTFSVQNKTGGAVKFYPKAVLIQAPKRKGIKRLKMDTPVRNPNHWENRTRNRKLPTGEIKKINILFIEEFNGKKVVF